MSETDDGREPIADGNSCTLATLYITYYGPLTKYARRFCRASVDDAEDIVHDVFAALVAGSGDWTLKRDILAYLRAAVRNQGLRRRDHASVVQSWIIECQSDPDYHLDPGSPEFNLLVQDVSSCVQKAIDALEPRYGDVYELRHLDHYSIDEIAFEMLVEQDTVQRYLTSAYNSIHNALLKEGIIYTRKKTIRF